LLGSEPHNGLNKQQLTGLFGPLILCTPTPAQNPLSQHHQQQVPQQNNNKCKVQNPWLPMECWHYSAAGIRIHIRMEPKVPQILLYLSTTIFLYRATRSESIL
jgi:hypothetical protein